MDAAQKSFRNAALLFAMALLVAAPGRAQSQLSATPNPVALSGTNLNVQVTVSGSGPFTIINQVGSFFSLSETADTAPTTPTSNLYVSVANTSCSNGGVTCSGSFTLHPTSSGGGTDVVVSVTFCPGGGCGGTGASGVISANPTSVTLNSVTGPLAATVNLTTASTTPVSFSVTTTPTSGSSWLTVYQSANSVSVNSSVTLNVYATVTGIYSQQTGTITITPGNGGAQTVIPVTLNVGTSGSSTYTLSPTSVSLAYPTGTTYQQIVIYNSSGLTTFNASVTNCNSSDFLTLTGSLSSGLSIANQPVSGNLTLTLYNPGILATGSYSCQVVVSNPSNASDQAVATVTLSVNGGGSSGGSFTFYPSSYSFTSAVGSTNTQSTGSSIQLSSSVQTTYNATFTSQTSPNASSNWIIINGIGSSVSNQAVTSGFSIALNNPQSFNAGSYSGYVTVSNPNTSGTATLAIYLTVGSGSSGGSYTLSSSSATFQYPCGTCSATVYVGSSTQTQYTATTSVSGGVANWLLVSALGTAGATVTGATGSSYPLTVYVNQSAVPAQTGTYQGQVTISTPSNSSNFTTFYVTLNQGVSGTGGNSATPTSLSFSTPVGVVPASQNVAVTLASSSSTFTSTLSAASGSVFVVSPCNGCSYTGNQNLAVSVNPGTLTAGTYVNYISLSSGGTTFANITVTLVVGGSGTTTGSIAAPTSLSFYWETGQSSPPYQTITVGASGTFTATPTQNWIALSTTTGSGPANLVVTVIPQSFTAGSSNQGAINISTPSGSQSVNVSLTVTSGVVLYSSPGTINLIGGGNQSAEVQIAASDNSAQTVTATSSTSWISLSSPTNSGVTPVAYLVTLNTAGLCNGLNTGSISATTSGAANSPLTIPVTVLVSGSTATSCATGPLTVSPTSMTFTAALNGSAPATQYLNVTASSGTYYSVSTSVQNGSWLSVTSPCTYCYGSQSLAVVVNQSGLGAGTYQGTIYLNTNGTVQQVGVTLTVGASGGSGNVSVSTSSLNFTAQVNGSAPAAQTVQVSSSTSGVGYTVTYTPSGTWLSLSNNGSTVSSGQSLTTPTNLSVNVNPSGLTASSAPYQGTITLQPNGGSTVTISVSLTVQANVVSASPGSLTFTYTAGGAAPPAQPVQVTSGTAGLTFSAQVSAGNCTSGWLVASPAIGTTPGAVSVSVNPGSVGVGTCNGSVTVIGTGNATGSTTINVSLTVAAPVLTINTVSSAASYLGSSISPGEIITIFGSNLGPTPYVTLALDSTGKVATTLCPPLPSGTNCSPALGVQVLVAGFAAPMVFASSTQVSAVVPYEVSQLHGSQPVEVKFLGQASNAIGVQIAPTAPGIFTANASGTGPGAISNQDYSANSPSNPAAKGSTVAIYLTGEGLTSPASATGSVTKATLPAPQVTPAPLLPVAVLIDGQPAAIAYAGEAPGIVAGVMQLNVQISTTARTGDLPLVVSIGGVSSQSGVTVSVH